MNYISIKIITSFREAECVNIKEGIWREAFQKSKAIQGREPEFPRNGSEQGNNANKNGEDGHRIVRVHKQVLLQQDSAVTRAQFSVGVAQKALQWPSKCVHK